MDWILSKTNSRIAGGIISRIHASKRTLYGTTKPGLLSFGNGPYGSALILGFKHAFRRPDQLRSMLHSRLDLERCQWIELAVSRRDLIWIDGADHSFPPITCQPPWPLARRKSYTAGVSICTHHCAILDSLVKLLAHPHIILRHR